MAAIKTATKKGGEISMKKTRLILTRLFIPTKLLGGGWTIWGNSPSGGEEGIDSHSLVLAEIDPAKIVFENCLRKGEQKIPIEERILRLKENPEFVLFGGDVFLGLLDDYQANEENSILEQIYRKTGFIYMNFPGTIIRYLPSKGCYILFFRRLAKNKWFWSHSYLSNSLSRKFPSVGMRSH